MEGAMSRAGGVISFSWISHMYTGGILIITLLSIFLLLIFY